MGTRYNRFAEAVLTNIHNLCFEQTFEFLSENFHFLVVKFPIYLNTRDFVMTASFAIQNAPSEDSDETVRMYFLTYLQTDLTFRWTNMSEGTFSDVAAHMLCVLIRRARRRGASNEYPQHMFLWRNKKTVNTIMVEEIVLSGAIA